MKEFKNAFDEPGPRKLRKMAVKEDDSDNDSVVQPPSPQPTSKKDSTLGNLSLKKSVQLG